MQNIRKFRKIMERKEETNISHDLPHDLISQEILSRLPVKSIYRCRSVCKLWYALPRDAKFVQTHSDRSLYSPKIIILSYKTEESISILSFYSFEMAESGNRTELLFTLPLYFDSYTMEPPCHGLVCFSGALGEEVYLCNPSTHEVHQLPRIDFYHPKEYCSGKVAGFGFDPLSREYKVLFAFQSRQSKSSKCFLFSLGSVYRQWRQVDDIPHGIQDMQSACLNGTLYWIIEDLTHYSPGGILSFDFRDEQYRVIPVPNCEDWKSYMECFGLHSDVYLKVIGGYLRLVTTLDGSNSGWWGLRCWTLKDPMNSVWTFEFKVTFYITSDSQRERPPILVDFKNGKVLLSAGNRLHMLDVKGDGDSEEIICGILDEDDANAFKRYQPGYVESLTSTVPPILGYKSYERDDVDKDEEMQDNVDKDEEMQDNVDKDEAMQDLVDEIVGK